MGQGSIPGFPSIPFYVLSIFVNHAEKLPDYLTSEMKGRVWSTHRRSITQPEVTGRAPWRR